MVTFTGSTATGRAIMAAAAPTVKRLQLELGGKSASIVLDDVSEEHVASMGIITSMIHAGQGCAIQTRMLLPEHLLDAYVEGAKASASSLKVGDPREPDTLIGPLIREQQRARVEAVSVPGIWPRASSTNRRYSSTPATTCASPRRRSSVPSSL
jgi:acyl-CoA reductase-like NAD-dependent aldehyde dehydrogenase